MTDAKKVVITDIEKLDPSLLDLSVAELERRATTIQMALNKKKEIEREQKEKADFDKALVIFDRWFTDSMELIRLGYFPDRFLDTVLVEGAPQFGRYIKRPKAPRPAPSYASQDASK